MDVLLIGAGAVGQVYGYHFARGGARVAFFVREKYADDARRGFTLYDLNRRRGRERPIHFDGFDVLTDMREVGERRWDVVVLCLSATALRKGTWLRELAGHLGDATLVNLTPDVGDHAVITRHVPDAQIVAGLIGLSSYAGPLPGGHLPTPGMCFWVPPLTKMSFSGERRRAREVADLLSAGGLASEVIPSAAYAAAFADPVLQLFVVALELADWSFEKLRADRPLMALGHRATREAFTAVAERMEQKAPLALRLIRPWILRLVMVVARFVVPFDLARFLEVHFSKVGDQTELLMKSWLALAAEQGNPAPAIQEMFDALMERRAEALEPRPRLGAAPTMR